MIVDTHMHTTCSDGRATVAEAVARARDSGVRIMAITDHDTIRAYPGAILEARYQGIIPVSGVELNTRDEDDYRGVHIVGLKISLSNRNLRRELNRLTKSRIDARRKLLANVNDYMAGRFASWVPARFEDVMRRVEGTVVKPHIAMELYDRSRALGLAVSEGEINRILRLPQIDVKKEGELTMAEAIALIKEAGGVPLLAHPCEYGEQVGPVMKKFHGLGGEATEICKYRYRTGDMDPRKGATAEDVLGRERQLNLMTIAMAGKYGLKITASSDFHGSPVVPGMETDEYGIDTRWLLE